MRTPHHEMAQGYLALVLHAHLPYVRHPESESYLEERWLYEAITETYIPLLEVCHGLLRDDVRFRLTMSITPTLLSMLTDPLLQGRYRRHLDSLIELAGKEAERTVDLPEFHGLALHYLDRFTRFRAFFLRYEGNLIRAFRGLQDLGVLEIVTSAATHAFLPNVQTEEAVRAQIAAAVDLHRRHFEQPPRGIWLPECGYRPGLDRILNEQGLAFFFTDSHGVSLADPKPVFGTMSPVLTGEGVAAFPRDEESSKQVWSSQEGYPGDYDYREYYRDIGYDLDYDYVRPYIHPDGIRINTGIKYHRITGKEVAKEPYRPEWAREKAARHAGNFLFNRERQVEHFVRLMGRKPLIVAPYDAELFGHWWYEGPMWLDFLLRKLHFDQDTVKTITPSEYLALYSDYQVCSLPMSSWGRDGYGDVWLRGENDWIYPALHEAERVMIDLANRHDDPDDLQRRALNQAARELMLAQSSDWAFIMDGKTMVDYAVKRTKQHLNRFRRLAQMIGECRIEESWLEQAELLQPIFPDLDYASYRSAHLVKRYEPTAAPRRILMLSWEFPPMTVGGLSRHVYDLSRYLVRQGCEVHVLTTECGEAPHEETVEGVHVHRVHVLRPDGCEFVHWAFQLNLMMIDAAEMLAKSGLTFDLIHAHDWLTAYAAKRLKRHFDLPLVATVHATEHGRNHGLHTDLQHQIHRLEWQLTYEASRVILCSTYMRREAESLFELPPDKLDVIPNGVDPEMLRPPLEAAGGELRFAADHERIVMYVGRLVYEKGIHTLLDAAVQVLADHPEVKFVIAGRGPAQQELQEQAKRLGVAEKVLFTGFISDESRNELLRQAQAAVFPSLYEPFGIVALEAMAAGTPVVVSDVGGLGDVVQHGHNGLKCFPNDPQSLALQVAALLADPEQGQRLAETARREIGRYDWNEIAQQTMLVYERALERNTAFA